jgi:predicted dehydrogenase
MLYHPAVRRLRDYIHGGELGEIYYLYSQRLNLGTIRSDENALWNFAPHDISMALHFFGSVPRTVVTIGESYLQPGIEDVVFLNIKFEGQRMAQIHMSWLDPHKIRRITLVGSNKMAVFDDMEGVEKVRLYDKGVEQVSYKTYGEALSLRFGDILIPRIPMGEPLRLECEHFLECVQQGSRPISDGYEGLRVLQVLEAAQSSLDQGGVAVEISTEPSLWEAQSRP